MPCPVVDVCGGCPLYTLSEDAERDRKLFTVQEALSATKTESGETRGHLEWVAAKSRTGYRNRIRMRIDEGGGVAFFNAHKDARCAALDPGLRRCVSRLSSLASARRPALAPFAHVEVRMPDARGRPSAFFVLRDGARLTDPARETLADLSRQFVIGLVDPGQSKPLPRQRYPVHGPLYVDVPVGRFMQVNSDVNALLVARIVENAVRAGLSTFADLYCGSGNFTIPLAAAGLRGVAVERCPDSISALIAAAEEQNLRVDASATDAIGAAEAWAAEGRSFDLVVVDAPRAGMKRKREKVAAICKKALALCSCNPDTFARDASCLEDSGLSLEAVTVFDMFPGTRHVEVLGWFTRGLASTAARA